MDTNSTPTMQKLVAEDPSTRSADIVAANIEQLKDLFPEAFTEGKVDFEVLKQLLGAAVSVHAPARVQADAWSVDVASLDESPE